MFSYTAVCIGPETLYQDASKTVSDNEEEYEEQKSLAASVV